MYEKLKIYMMHAYLTNLYGASLAYNVFWILPPSSIPEPHVFLFPLLLAGYFFDFFYIVTHRIITFVGSISISLYNRGHMGNIALIQHLETVLGMQTHIDQAGMLMIAATTLGNNARQEKPTLPPLHQDFRLRLCAKVTHYSQGS